MTPEEFEQAVLADEITDFESYLQEPNNIKEKLRNEPYRLVLLKHGIEIERILELDPTLAIGVCIQEGLLPERYDEWKAMNQEWIMETFAENGYYLDELIESEYDDVRKAVIENHPDFCIKQLNQGKIYQIVHDYIKNKDKPNLKLFKAYIDALTSNSNDMGLMTKYRALTKVPSTIEKTMSDVQLFFTNKNFRIFDGATLRRRPIFLRSYLFVCVFGPIMASENAPLTDYMDDYVRDCKNSMNPVLHGIYNCKNTESN